MENNQEYADRLLAFKQRDKFSQKAWNERGLNPSAVEVSNRMNAACNSCVDKLMSAIEVGSSRRRLKAILKSELRALNRLDYDTEEKEFICDLFYEMSGIVGVDIRRELERWLYGALLAALLTLKRLLRPKRILETYSQPCDSCGVLLESYVMQKKKGIPGYWNIVKCSACQGYNLLAQGPDIKQLGYGKYDGVESLSKDDFTSEQAMIRLDQIKYFRK